MKTNNRKKRKKCSGRIRFRSFFAFESQSLSPASESEKGFHVASAPPPPSFHFIKKFTQEVCFLYRALCLRFLIVRR